MDDLVQWLRAQLDEDLRIAEAATGHHWDVCDETTPYLIHDVDAYRVNRTLDSTVGRVAVAEAAEDRSHIAEHDPARVLREVDAKRRLLYQFEHRGNSVRATAGLWDGGVWDDMLRLLALPYADRPGYRPEWRP